jgi:hypothetical protein
MCTRRLPHQYQPQLCCVWRHVAACCPCKHCSAAAEPVWWMLCEAAALPLHLITPCRNRPLHCLPLFAHSARPLWRCLYRHSLLRCVGDYRCLLAHTCSLPCYIPHMLCLLCVPFGCSYTRLYLNRGTPLLCAVLIPADACSLTHAACRIMCCASLLCLTRACSYTCLYLNRGTLTFTAPVMVNDPLLSLTKTDIGAMTSAFPAAYGK